jgi:hypothetical protein
MDRTLCGLEAMADGSPNHRLAKATFNSPGDELDATVLESSDYCLLSEMEAKLTPAGQKKYKAARENYPLSDEDLAQIKSSKAKKNAGENADNKATRGKSPKLTYELLCEKLGEPIWYERKLSRVLNGEESLTEAEARHLSETLKIDFVPSDFEIKQGPAPAQPLDPQDSVPPSSNSAPDWRWSSTIDSEARQPCNPTPLRAAVSDDSIPDPFASSDFHLKVSIEETGTTRLQPLGQPLTDTASRSCRMRFSLYQGQDVVPSDWIVEAGFSMDPLCFPVNDPAPLIDQIKQLRAGALNDCRDHHGANPAPIRLHLHLMLPVTWLPGPLPETIQKHLGRHVFFGCSKRAELEESAVTQLRSQAIKVNQRLHSGGALSCLGWATVRHEEAQAEAFDQLFQASEKVLHLKASSLDSEARHCDLVGRDALFATDPSLLFVDRSSSVSKGWGEADVCRRWKRLVVIGMPLVLWWRDGRESLSQNVEQLGRVFSGSWSTLCDHLELLVKVLNSQDESGLEMQALMAQLGIFYEEPLRCTRPDSFLHPRHTTR